MKVFLHIENEIITMDPEVRVEIECSAAPRRGDLLYLPDPTLAKLEKSVLTGGLLGRYSNYIYGTPGRFRLSFDDCIYVKKIVWMNHNARYECHVELYDGNEAEPTYRRLSSAEEEQVREKWDKDHKFLL